MRKLSFLLLLAQLCAAAAAAQQQGAATRPATDDAAARFKTQVEAISAGVDTAARRAAITKRLDDLRVQHDVQVFKHGERVGANVVARLGGLAAVAKGSKRLMLGAHLDRVARGQGAVDNASGCAAVLELLAALRARPLKNYSVEAVFFDFEEAGLVGSKAFVVSDGGRHVPDVFVNFDVFGYGDTLYVTAGRDDAPLARAFARAAADAKLPLVLAREYPPSDHLSFAGTRAEVASVSIVGGDEIKPITQLLRGERPERIPRALSLIHTPADTADKIDAAAAARAVAAIERALRLLDSPQP